MGHRFWVPLHSAYAAIVMFPSMSSLRFDPAIRAMKQQWNASSPQYAAFWCGTTVLRSLISQPVKFGCRIQVRNRLIIVWRLLHLYRSVDLAHLRRLWAKGPNGELHIAAQRKAWLSYRWERVMVLPNHPTTCPLHPIVRYMHITLEGTPRGPLLIGLVKPHGALSSDRVGALTKQILHTQGVDVTHYKPHTTRGAGKLMHKQINLPPDISCEIGSWANYEAYCKHYNWLGDVDTAATALHAHLAVHTTPSPSCAAEAPLHTPPSEQAAGRNKGNKAAQDWVGPTPPPKARPKPTKVPMLRGWRSSPRLGAAAVSQYSKRVRDRDEGPERKSARTTSGRRCTAFVLDEA